jgi:hypothetical protein
MHKRMPVWLWAAIASAGVGVLGLVDWWTGVELNFFVFYFVPVSVGAWFLGFGTSVILGVLSALVWYGADFLSGHTYSSPFYAVWNTMIRLGSFIAIGWAVSKVQVALAREQATADTLRRTLSEIKLLEAFLPICSQCKKIRNQQGVWQEVEGYIEQHSNSVFSHGYCPECLKQVMKEARLGDKQTEP